MKSFNWPLALSRKTAILFAGLAIVLNIIFISNPVVGQDQTKLAVLSGVVFAMVRMARREAADLDPELQDDFPVTTPSH